MHSGTSAGSRRRDSYRSVSSMGSIRSVGFQNSDGSIVVIALNTSELPETISVGADASWFAIALDGGAGMTMVLPNGLPASDGVYGMSIN